MRRCIMRFSGTGSAPLSALTTEQKLATGSLLAALGAVIIVLAPLLGWTHLARPWSFLVGLAGGMAAGIGVPLSICGLVGVVRKRR
jgi:hypothetical protein